MDRRMEALERVARGIEHQLANNLNLKTPKGYGQTKTSGWLAADVPDWQLRQWLRYIRIATAQNDPV